METSEVNLRCIDGSRNRSYRSFENVRDGLYRSYRPDFRVSIREKTDRRESEYSAFRQDP